jgi:sigma-B regulation protein RsbU (phosphoserine phosphatase)
VRLWRFDGRGLRLSAGVDPGWALAIPAAPGVVDTPAGGAWLTPVSGVDGFWVEVGGDGDAPRVTAERVAPLLAALLIAERERAFAAEELTSRYEEIDLLYAISEILGQTVRLEEAAQTIVREVSSVVGARRASIMVYDEEHALLRTVAARGFPDDGHDEVDRDDPVSVAARVFREGRVVAYDPVDPGATVPAPEPGKGYRGDAYLSVPICYAAPGTALRCVGVINLTDRIGGDRFTAGDRKLVTAIANQIGAAIENARLVQRDLQQQRLRRELELAHDLQLRLLPSPSVLHGDAHVAARCVQAESVGGDFYTFTRLGGGRVGVMLGDVSSHGFSAALVMALVMSAAGIHAAAAATPEEALTALLASLETELASAEMHFSVFYGVLDPAAGRIAWSNAGHPHAFRIARDGAMTRLEATAPPLGLTTPERIGLSESDWAHDDLLCLWTDGLVDVRNAAGERFGEKRLLDALTALRALPAETIVADVMGEVDAFSADQPDDRTLLVLRL